MPKGPRGEKRPADVNAAAVMVARIATGEVTEDLTAPARRRRAKMGGTARAEKLSDTQRSEIARVAAEARWKKSKD